MEEQSLCYKAAMLSSGTLKVKFIFLIVRIT